MQVTEGRPLGGGRAAAWWVPPVALGLLVLAAGGLALAWTTTGSEPAVVGWWLAVVGFGVLLPGWALVRCLHGAGRMRPTWDGRARPASWSRC